MLEKEFMMIHYNIWGQWYMDYIFQTLQLVVESGLINTFYDILKLDSELLKCKSSLV